jgi:hypothetical protein
LNTRPTYESATVGRTYESRVRREDRDMDPNSVRWAVRCRAHRKDGSQCKRWATRGAYVCRSHGAASPQVRRAAEMRLTEIAAYRTLAAWQRSPAAAEAQERAALAGDRAAVEALAARLG